MEKNKLTKELLAENFRELMLQKDFEKITVKNITDAAGVIRPTFYYHFQDKYAVVEYILHRDAFERAAEFAAEKRLPEAVHSFLSAFENDKAFYRRAFRIEGQNSFEEMLQMQATELWKELFRAQSPKLISSNRLMQPDIIARYFGTGLANIVKTWIETHKGEADVSEVEEMYLYLIHHSFEDLTEP